MGKERLYSKKGFIKRKVLFKVRLYFRIVCDIVLRIVCGIVLRIVCGIVLRIVSSIMPSINCGQNYEIL